MGISSLGMLIVSVFLAWNARRMRLINEKNVEIALWQQRWEVYRKISNWPIEVKNYIEFTKLKGHGTGEWGDKLNELGVIDIANYLDQGILLYGQNKNLVKIIKKYKEWLEPAISHSIFKAEEIGRVNGTLANLVDWYIREYRLKHQQRFEEFLTL